MNGGGGKNGRDLTEDEALLWDLVTERDKRWKKVKRPAVKAEDKKPENKKPVKSKAEEKPTAKPKAKIELPYLDAGEVVGVDRSTADKLRRGKMKIEAVCDMHGMNRNDALDNLRSFIFSCRERKKKCVLIITGKGAGVLKNSLPKWLNIEDIRPHILMFNYAQPKDGGDGAVYVLLRRK